MENNQVSGWRKEGIVVIASLATLVGSASLGGCVDNHNRPYLIADKACNHVSLLAYDKDGI